jgi:DNA transformation protein
MSGTVEHVLEKMTSFGVVTTKKMFGAITFYHDGLIFGMIIDDHLFLKGDDVLKGEFELEGLSQFIYHSKSDKATAMPYWRAPERCMDDADDMKIWFNKAFEAAKRTQKPAKKPKKK